jgi:hypothetical protein
MEAVWRRLILLLVAGLLLTLSFFPMQVFSLPSQVNDKIYSPECVRSKEPLKEDHNTHMVFHSSRALFNCSMIMEIDTPDDPITRGEDFYISGRFLIDRGIKGKVDPDDIPAKLAWLDLYWLDGTSFYELRTIITDDEGRWNTTFSVQAPYWTENTMLRIRFKGEWNDGSGPKNLSFRDYDILMNQELLKDDDGDNRSDEEKLDHVDNDNDGLIDEDVNAWITKDPIIIDIPFEIRHLPFLECNITTKLVKLGTDPKIGITCNLSDPSQPYGMIGRKRLQIKIDDEVLYEGEAAPTPTDRRSILNTVVEIDDDTKAGAHELKVILDPKADPVNNSGYVKTEVSKEIIVRRPLSVMFENIDQLSGTLKVYRDEKFWINGTIFDYLEYEKTGKMVPPWIYSDLDPSYQFWLKLRFGDPIDLFSFEVNPYSLVFDKGKFSFELNPHMRSIPLGYHICTLEFIPSGWSSGDAPFEVSNHSFTCEMRARTRISIWIDQNKNSIDDENEKNNDPLDDPIIRTVPRYDNDGRVYDWRFFRILGMVIDLSQSSGVIRVGVPGCEVDLFFGYGMDWERKVTLRTDANGNFEVDVPIQVGYGCGPVPIRVEITNASKFYDLAVYEDLDGNPFSIVLDTKLVLEPPEGTLGEVMKIKGKLTDEYGIRVKGALVSIYSNRRYYLDPEDDVTVQTDYMFLGSVVADHLGNFSFDHNLEPDHVGVPQYYARYSGSVLWPYGEEGAKYHAGDAFYGCESERVKARILARVNLTDVESVEYLVRNGEANMRGRLVMSTRWGPTDRGINGLKVRAEITQDGHTYFFDEGYTKSKDGEDGWFRLKIQSVPRALHVGIVEIKVHVINGTFDREQRVAIPASITLHSQVWSSTRIKEIYFGPNDAYDYPFYYYADFQMGETENWVFTYQVLEGSTEVTSGGPVVGGIVWLNITMNEYVNCTWAVTDENGMVRFNFTSDFTDSRTGEAFRILPSDHQANLTLQVNFIGMTGYTSSIKTRFSVIRRPRRPYSPTLSERIENLFPGDMGVIAILVILFGTATVIILGSVAGIRKEMKKRRKAKMISTMRFIRIDR